MTSVKLTRVFRGKQATKNGEMDKVSIKAVEYGDKWIGALFDPKKGISGTESWKEGDNIEIFISEKDGYMNFALKSSDASKATDALKALEARVKVLEDTITGSGSTETPDDF